MGKTEAGLAVVSGIRLTDRIGIGVLTRLIDRDLVDDVLAETGRAEQRSRLLPARVVVYYVLGLCLFFGDAYEEVMRLLVAGLHFTGAWQKGWQVPTTGAISQARQRLGAAPVQLLFERVAVPCAQRGTRGAWLGSRRLMAIDGFLLDIPDTKENDEAFGRSGGENKRAPFPQVRLVGLGECGTHAIVAARLAAWRTSERTLARELSADFEPGMLIIADRGFYSWQFWQEAASSGADLLWRMQEGPSLPVMRAFPDGSYESFLLDPKVRARRAGQRRRGSENIDEPSGIPVRVVEYEVTNRKGKDEIFCLITTIMDPDDASAAELAAAYQERWEFESSLDEIKTHQRGRGGVLRSKSPEWSGRRYGLSCSPIMRSGTSCAKLRTMPAKTQTDCRLCDPFVSYAARSPTRRRFPPCRLVNALTATFAEILERLNPPRRNRSSPRVVKRVNAHAYKAKRFGDVTTRYPTPPNIHILAVA